MIKEGLLYFKGLCDQAIALLKADNGNQYSRGDLKLIKEPVPATFGVSTLQAIVDYLISDADALAFEKLLLHVKSPREVILNSPLTKDTRQRECFITASLPYEVFAFGQWFDQESFAIALQSQFDETEDSKKLLEVAGNITEEAIRISEDDGVTQTATGKTGIARVGDMVVPNPVSLRPYRTFTEVAQPESKFVFRMRSGSAGRPPTMALFESDAGAWKLEAIKTVAAWLEVRLDAPEFKDKVRILA